MAQVITLRTPKTLPDVPEDIELHLAHLNDPNYSFDSHEWSEDSFELDDKRAPPGSPLSTGKNYESDIETQSDYSRSSSHFATSRAPLQSDA
jgi:hypothetical protein